MYEEKGNFAGCAGGCHMGHVGHFFAFSGAVWLYAIAPDRLAWYGIALAAVFVSSLLPQRLAEGDTATVAAVSLLRHFPVWRLLLLFRRDARDHRVVRCGADVYLARAGNDLLGGLSG